MATITLDDVTIELMQANVTLEKIDSNTALTNEFLNLSVDTFKKGFGDMLEFFKGNSLADLEREREQAEFNKDMLAALQDLKPEYTGPDKAAVPQDAKFGLGALLTGLAIAIGAAIGVIRAQLQAIKAFVKALTPNILIERIRKAITSFVAGLSMGFDLFKSAIADKLKMVRTAIFGVFDNLLGLFKADGKLSSIGKFFSEFSIRFMVLFDPFIDAFRTMQNLITPSITKTAGFFSTIGNYFTTFAQTIGKVAGIVGKLFLPLTIIMTVWDTVKGFSEGLEKDGIIGGIAGAIKGFFNSLIFGPIDMLKDATAWVLGFFGFDKAKEFLKSFSFEDMFTSVIDAIFSPLEMVKKLMNGVVNFFTDIGKQIKDFFTGFEIPGFSILGKQFGPWRPFGSKDNETTSAPQSATAPANTTPGAGATPSMAPRMGNVDVAADKDTLTKYALEEAQKSGRDKPTREDRQAAMLRLRAERSAQNVQQPSQSGMAVQSGQQLQTAAQENGMLNAAPARGGNGGGAGGGNVSQNNSTTVVNNSTVVVKPIPSATRRPNNSEDIFFRGAAAGYA